ncbi:hypothetical protein NVV94_04760 [Pseudomonas sp. LS1212]|uniref:hypothetical protein n=1 Tax=Pseudomonas sp. LS1212 TaxID=2972478 RepID=UPI00215C5361|nr:hypothetical protein [Pseudomonas sp. LS1212]UVJ44898.1 hypothetical protein NVV94_04760 [Pseudomonas sp. LS1212]
MTDNTLIKITKANISNDEISILDGAIQIPTHNIIERIHLDKNSALIVSGTLIEGIGNIHSDIDCIVLCEERPKANDVAHHDHALVTDINYHFLSKNDDVHNTTDFYGNKGLHIDTDYITFSEVEDVILKIENAFNEVVSDQRFLYSPALLERENNIVHRSLTGCVLVNQTKFNQLKKRIPVEKHLYVAHREKLPVFYAFQDIQGCWQSGNLWMGCEIARDLMLKTTMSFTYLTGVTNKHPKWIYSNLFRIRGFEHIKNTFYSLSRKGAISEVECRLFIEETLEYIDTVFLAMQGLLQKCETYPTLQESLNALNHEFDSRKHTEHKISTCEYYFRKKYFAAEDTPSLNSLLKEWG